MSKKYKVIMIMLVILSLASITFGLSNVQKVEAYLTDIKVYSDDKLLNLVDGDGNVIKPLVYNGVSYLPVKTVAETFDKNVSWDGETRSIYLGKHESIKPITFLNHLDVLYKSAYIKIEISKDIVSNLGVSYNGSIRNSYYRKNEMEYFLDDSYSKLEGTVILTESSKNNSYDSEAVEIWGDEKLLFKSPVMTKGSLPVDFNIDLAGVSKLKIIFYNNSSALVDLGLYQ